MIKPSYSQTPQQVVEDLQSDARVGLAAPEITRRQQQYGLNLLPPPKLEGPIRRFLRQFNNVLIYMLLGSAGIAAVLGEWTDASVIVGVVLLNALIGFIQEGKAVDALASIKAMLSPQAMVFRGQQQSIDATQLVPGDIVLLQAGDKVPADLRLISCKSLKIQESALTGESSPIDKQIEPVVEDSVLADRRCMAYSGTTVTQGQGSGVVVATGLDTEIGAISRLVASVAPLSTPLIQQMDAFAGRLTVITLVVALLTSLIGIFFWQYSLAAMFLAAVSLAVAAIPESLPAIITITLAVGVQRMAARNAIVRRLPAVETLGEVTVICTDKTGTLTRNEMTLTRILCNDNNYNISGVGYDPHGQIESPQGALTPAQATEVERLLLAGALCNDAALICANGMWQVQGDPMEGAMLVAAYKIGHDSQLLVKQWPRQDLIPFDTAHKFMATLHHDHRGEGVIFLKGAPEAVLARCQSSSTQAWLDKVERMASEGLRVLAIAQKTGKITMNSLTFADVEGGFTLLGLIGFIDPPREEAIHAIHDCRNAGINVKMITGDHATTALAIGRQLGLKNTEKVMTGQELSQLSESDLITFVERVDVFARVDPQHKLRLVEALQSLGHVVAMTGDGVNDAPALRRADVGTAMGKVGTEAAKDAADMVLVDDNFATISRAVSEGRTIYDNIRKSFVFILPTSVGEALVIMAAIILGLEHLPLTPVLILWVNMVTAVTLALALAFEPPEPYVMQRPPRAAEASLLDSFLLWRVIFVGVLMMLGTFAIYSWNMAQHGDVAIARSAAVNTLVMFEIFYLFNSRRLLAPAFTKAGLFANVYVWWAIAVLVALQLMLTYSNSMQALFGTAPISPLDWLQSTAVASSVLFSVEIEKWWLRQRRQ